MRVQPDARQSLSGVSNAGVLWRSKQIDVQANTVVMTLPLDQDRRCQPCTWSSWACTLTKPGGSCGGKRSCHIRTSLWQKQYWPKRRIVRTKTNAAS